MPTRAAAFSNDAHVAFGVSPPVDRDADALGATGFAIKDTLEGFTITYSEGHTLDGRADVNGDGRPDLALGNHHPGGCIGGCEVLPRRAAVLFGGPSAANVDINSIGARGFRIDQTGPRVLAGDAAMAGDVNGDVRADILVGRRTGGPTLVYGKAATGTVFVDQLGEAGVELTGADPEGDGDLGFDGVGDQTGDFLADVAVADDASDRVYVTSLVPPPARQLAIIAFRVVSFGLGEPLSGQLIDRLTATRTNVNDGQTRAACLRLAELTQFAVSRNGNGLNGAQTFELVASANRVSRSLGC